MSKYELIKKTFYSSDEGFTGVDKLYRKLSSKGVTKANIKEFLDKQEVYQTTKKNNRKLSSFIPKFPLQEFQMDLIFMKDPHVNNNSRYGLSVIDVFTKKATVVLLKKKDQNSILDAVNIAFNTLGLPETVFSDEGSEFISTGFKNLMKELGIKLLISYGHAPFIERFNRTIKEMMEKYLESKNTKDIASVLDKLLDNYNNSYHSVIGMSPNEVNEKNMHTVQLNIIKHSVIKRKPIIKVDDIVRIKLKDKKLKKGYKTKYSKSVYKIVKIEPPYYYIEGERQPYLAAQLQKVSGVEMNPEKNIKPKKTVKSKARAVEIELPELNINERAPRNKTARNLYNAETF